MNILLLDSATEACTCAISTGTQTRSSFEIAPRGHAEKLLPMAERLLAELGIGYADLDLIAFGHGPGSFTGVRIATACAQGIALGLDLPMLGISSLATLAQGALEKAGPDQTLHAAIDARMGEVYYGSFARQDDGRLVALTDEQVCHPEQLELHGGLGVGSGFGRYAEQLIAGSDRADWPLLDGKALPHAADAIVLARQAPRSRWLAPEAAEPVYLRNNVATPPRASGTSS